MSQGARRRTFIEARRRSLHAADSARDLKGHKEGPGYCVSERRKTQLANRAIERARLEPVEQAPTDGAAGGDGTARGSDDLVYSA